MSLLHKCELSQTLYPHSCNQIHSASENRQQDKGPKGDYCGRRTALSSMTINVSEKE